MPQDRGVKVAVWLREGSNLVSRQQFAGGAGRACLRNARKGVYVQMASVGRAIFWICLTTGIGCLIYALHMLLEWPAPQPDPSATSMFSTNTMDAMSVAWWGLALIAVALVVGHFVWQSEE